MSENLPGQGVKRVMAVLKLKRQKLAKVPTRQGAPLNIASRITINGAPGVLSSTGGDTIVEFPAAAESSQLCLDVPSDLIIKTHGHCFGIYGRNLVKIAEGTVDATCPVVLKEINYASLPNEVSVKKQSIRMSIPGPHQGASLRIRQEGFWLQERPQSVDPEGPWRRWHDGDRPLTYLLDPPRTASGRSRLVVVFTAIGNPYDFRYNYRSAISDVDAYRLFVLDDFGSRGSYYLSDHRDMSIYASVQKFLKATLAELRINAENSIFAGSSKGGTAALIHGLPLEVGKIIVGAPQFKPGTYLSHNAPDMLKFISGASDMTGRQWLDDAVGELLLGKPSATQVHVLVGDADHHLKAHVRPLEAQLRISGVSVNTLVVRGVTHQDIGRPFGAFLGRLAGDKGRTNNNAVPYKLSWQPGNGNRAQLKIWVPAGETIAVRAFSGSHLLDARTYSTNDTYVFEVPRGEPLRVRVFRRASGTHRILGAFTTAWLRP